MRPTSATGIRSAPERRGGFTLLELLLAMALIGLAVMLVRPSVVGLGAPRALDTARALADRIALAHEEGGFTGRVLGLRWHDDPGIEGDEGLEFLLLTRAPDAATTAWGPVDPRDALLAPEPLGGRYRATLEVEDAAVERQTDAPSVLLLPDGELTPFVLTLVPRDAEGPAVRLVGTVEGELRLEQVD